MTDLEVTEIVRAFVELGVVPNNDQAMALVKKFRLTMVWTDARLDGWRVRGWRTGKTGALCEEADADDLSRAVVECVAKLQSAA